MFMDEVKLDQKAFRTLASESRVGILKALVERRKTLSELSKELKMSVSTTSEHLDQLVSAELILQIDDGHKWKYYELTRKGRNVLFPGEARILVILGLAAFGFVGVAYSYFQKLIVGVGQFAVASDAAPEAAIARKSIAEPIVALPILTWELAALVALGAIAGISAYRYLAVKRRF